MQTRFAVVTLLNSETANRTKVLVGYFNKRWSAVKIDNRTAAFLNLRDSGAREARVSEVRYGFGTVNNEKKPLIEIAMLIKRHAVLAPRSVYYDDPMDWKVEENKEVSLAEIFRSYNTAGYKDGVRNLLLRLLAMDNETSSQRLNALLGNLNERYATVPNPSMLSGIMAATPGATWRGSYYDTTYGPQHIKEKRAFYKRLGGLLSDCIRMSRLGENYEGLYNELLGLLAANDTAPQWFSPMQTQRVKQALEKMHNNTIVLAQCGHFAEDTARLPVGGPRASNRQLWCPHCYERNAVTVADRPGERWPTDLAHWSERHRAYYSYDIDDMESPREGRSGRAIMDYTTNVTRVLERDMNIKSSHYGDFLMGIELEMTSGNAEHSLAAKDVRRRLGNDYCIVKHDGSLPSNGFEVVTAPRGLAEHVERFAEWEINSAYRAWDTGSCGMHVHIHSRAFTEMSLGKFVMFINLDTNATFLRKLAGRHPLKDSQAARYCANEQQSILENPKMAMKGKSPERYRMVNMTNLSKAEAERLGYNPLAVNGKYDTIEVRVYKSSLRKERLLAQIEFTHAAVMFCRVASYQDLSSKAFLQWLAPNSKLYPNLANWFGVRKSKAIKDAGGKPLEETCADKSPPGEITPAARAPRARGTLPSTINDVLTATERARRASAAATARRDRFTIR